MRRLGRVLLIAAMTVLIVGCAGTTSTKSHAASGKMAKIGDPLTLEGYEGVEMKVTPTKLIDPLEVGEYDSPMTRGDRIVGVNVVLKNVGKGTYSDSPSNGAKLITASNRQADSTIVSGGPCAGGFAEQATIAPGSTVQGCIPFEVPGQQAIKKFQFTLESGFGPQAGEWAIR